MKKFLIVFMCAIAFMFAPCLTAAAATEEVVTPTPEEPKYNATINVVDSEGGIILFDNYEGMAGDTVKIKYEAGLLYTLKNIYVNGVEILPNENGEYVFTLVEGENKITSYFEVDNDQLKEIAGLLDKVKNQKWNEIFNVTNLFTIINWVITTFCSSGFFITLLKMKKQKVMTMNELNEGVNKNINENVSAAITNVLTNTITPLINQFLEATIENKKTTTVLTRCTILAQEGTPEAKLAILKELENLPKEKDDLSEKVKKIIDDEISKERQTIIERDEAIEELKRENDNLEKPHL